MHPLRAPIIILAGAIAFGCGTIANAIEYNRGEAGEIVGTILLILGGLMLLKPLWDAIPVETPQKPGGGKDSDNLE